MSCCESLPQALSKIERGFQQDLDDAAKMIERGLVEPARLRELYEAIEPELYRYPAMSLRRFAASSTRRWGSLTILHMLMYEHVGAPAADSAGR